ncbi:uncharacterized protein [Epargyreus clarus]|uniref:uncharacterized protein isoform X2 n=1 Tax=Epargyreus clarus TaxID=520877 RepID=UPI003C2B2057
MQKIETTWRSSSNWKARYSKLYSSQRISLVKQEEPRRISFMSNDSTPYATLLSRMRSNNSTADSGVSQPHFLKSILSHRNDSYSSNVSDNWGGMETQLLDMVRSRSSEQQSEARDKASSLPHHDESEEESNDVCMHGLNYRMTERSVSRSRVSRMSMRRDMDIPSILAFPTNITAPVQLEIPAFQKAPMIEKESIPKWSIRRSICPVCSQKWKDRSSIIKVKSSVLLVPSPLRLTKMSES